jgi:hypothetical protein
MTRRFRIVLGALVVVVLAIAGWWGADRLRDSASSGTMAERDVGPGSPVGTAKPARRAPALSFSAHAQGEVTITGHVIDIQQPQRPVAGVDVVFRSDAGDASTVTERDGSYAIQLAAGMYRAFVRDDAVLSIGRRDPMRLPWHPPYETAKVPDEALMASVIATRDTDGVDLSVVRSGILSGQVVDEHGRPIAGAMLNAGSGGMRPVIATDIAVSGGDGSFELRLPPGVFLLAANHPRFAGIARGAQNRFAVKPGERVQITVVLEAGCVITGRVVARDGGRGGDGAIERQWGTGDLEFVPAGAIEADGTFHWATTEEGDVTLRAWPWKSPPSLTRRFACRDGARFDDVVFQLTERRPDLEGVLVDRTGQPLGYSFIDLRPLDPGGVGQQERTDASGHWEVYSVPPGRYRVVAEAERRGVASTVIVSPRDGVRLELGGTGRLEGTTPRLASGSFELVLERCGDGAEIIPLPQSRRLVTVAGGRFAVDDLPACELSFAAVWRDHAIAQHVAIPAGGVAQLELNLGEPREKTVHGTVRDTAGKPIAGAVVTALRTDDQAGLDAATTRTNDAGAFTIKAFSGASLTATARGRVGGAMVGGANVDAEQVDLVIEDADDTETNH